MILNKISLETEAIYSLLRANYLYIYIAFLDEIFLLKESVCFAFNPLLALFFKILKGFICLHFCIWGSPVDIILVS